jgi:hypothetical protein
MDLDERMGDMTGIVLAKLAPWTQGTLLYVASDALDCR